MKITKDTYVPIGVAATLFLALLSGGVWLNSALGEMRYSVKLIQLKIEQMERKLDDSLDDRWTSSDMEHWSSLLQAKNKDLHVPEPVPEWKKRK